MARLQAFAIFLAISAFEAFAQREPCRHATLTRPSQTLHGTGLMREHFEPVTHQGTMIPARDITVRQNISQSVDTEEMNCRVHISQEVEVSPKEFQMKQDVEMILNYAGRSLTTRTIMNDKEPVCVTIRLPSFLPPARVLTQLSKWAEGFYKCREHRDGVDVFGMEFPPRFIPVPLPISARATMGLDEDGLVQWEKFSEKMNIKPMVMSISMDMEFHDGKLGGPSEADLVVPEGWGECKEFGLPKEIDDILKDLEKKFVGPARLLPHVLRFALSENEAATMVV